MQTHVRPDWMIEEALGAEKLVRLLPDLRARHHDIHLLWPTATVAPARLQVAIAALTPADVEIVSARERKTDPAIMPRLVKRPWQPST